MVVAQLHQHKFQLYSRKSTTISFNTSTSNVLIVNLASGNGTGGYNGMMRVEWLIPLDLQSNWTIS